MKVLAQECGPHRIRVNAVCPTTVHTPLVINDATFELFAPDKENPGEDDVREAFEGLNILPGVAWIEPQRRLRRRRVPVLGRRQVHHRRRAPDRRRQHRQNLSAGAFWWRRSGRHQNHVRIRFVPTASTYRDRLRSTRAAPCPGEPGTEVYGTAVLLCRLTRARCANRTTNAARPGGWRWRNKTAHSGVQRGRRRTDQAAGRCLPDDLDALVVDLRYPLRQRER